MECFLNELRPGDGGLVTALPEGTPLTRRLREFGLVPPTAVRCRYWGPGGHLTALELRGAVIAVRREDLGKIPVRRL